MRLIPLTQGQFAMVDDDRFEELIKVKWQALWAERSKTFYAVHNSWNMVKQKHELFIMHRVILNAPEGIEVDHRDKNGLNNLISNIRLATTSQNQCNRGKASNNKSGFKGVSWEKKARKWRAEIAINGKNFSLGNFNRKSHAILAYNEAALRLHGEFAYQNVIPEDFKDEVIFRYSRNKNASGFRGVYWESKHQKWRVRIESNHKRLHVGLFDKDCILDAARAYNEAAIKIHGENAFLNDILEDLMCCC